MKLPNVFAVRLYNLTSKDINYLFAQVKKDRKLDEYNCMSGQNMNVESLNSHITAYNLHPSFCLLFEYSKWWVSVKSEIENKKAQILNLQDIKVNNFKNKLK